MIIPQLIEGNLFIDSRGFVSYVNNFDLTKIIRFYITQNHRQGFVRAWHGHKRENKYFYVIQGEMLICGVEIDNWENPSKDLKIYEFVLSHKKPAVLFIPGGFANGLMSLSPDAKVLIFSNFSLKESLMDDFRFEPRFWNPWDKES